MNSHILMGTNDPTDLELSELMSEVAIEAKRKAVLAKQKLDEKIKNEILNVKEKMKTKLI